LIQIRAAARLLREAQAMFTHRLAREVAIIVAVKVMIVILAAVFVFGPKQRLKVDDGVVGERFFSFPASSSSAPVSRSPHP